MKKIFFIAIVTICIFAMSCKRDLCPGMGKAIDTYELAVDSE